MAVADTPKSNNSDSSSERAYRRKVFAWSMYDWADHAFITTTSSTFFPPYFVAIASAAFLVTNPGMGDEAARTSANNIFAFTVSLALFIAALIAPILGTYADITGRRKRLLVVATGVGGILASAMFTVTSGLWGLGLVLYIGTQVALNIALGLNSSLLPYVARKDDMNRASGLGYAMGYFGGGILLLINTALYLFAGKLGLDDGTAVRIAFLTVGIWWIVFTVPIALVVPEPPAVPQKNSKGSAIRDTFVRLRHTLSDIQRYRELFKMLVAFWLYSEGIGAIILLATAYGKTLGLGTSALIATLLMTQFVAFPYALIYARIPNKELSNRASYVAMLIWTGATMPIIGLFANLNGDMGLPLTFGLIAADQILGVLFSHFVGRRLFARFTETLDTKRAVILGLAIYTIIPVWGFFLRSQAEFFMIGWLVGTVQGGTQALSRTIYSRLSPKAKSGEFFGLYGLSEKFAGILGPLLYGIVGVITGSPKASVLSIGVFFLLGIYALWRVDEPAGEKVAAAEDAQISEAHAAA